MDELRESSLLFSLEGLLETERERVQREAREAQKRGDEMTRVAEQASRRRVAQQREREARERRLALEQERERHESERIEAMKRATIERARIEAEAKMRLVEVEQTRQHELKLVQLRERQLTVRYRVLTWLSSAALLLSLTGASFAYFGHVRPAQAAQRQQLQRAINGSTEQNASVERMLAAERAKNQTLSERVRELEARPPAPAAARPEPKAQPLPGQNRQRPPASSERKRCKDNGDPLDGCVSSGSR